MPKQDGSLSECASRADVVSTSAALALIAELTAEYGPVMFHQSAGCCDGSSPMGYLRSEFRIGESDLLLGEVGEAASVKARFAQRYLLGPFPLEPLPFPLEPLPLEPLPLEPLPEPEPLDPPVVVEPLEPLEVLEEDVLDVLELVELLELVLDPVLEPLLDEPELPDPPDVDPPEVDPPLISAACCSISS